METPIPNMIRFGFGTGFLAASTEGLEMAGETAHDGYGGEHEIIKVTEENHEEMVRVLRYIADYFESAYRE